MNKYILTKVLNNRLSFSLGLLVFLINACTSDGKRKIQSYYYPLEDLKEGLVYEYQPINNDSLSVDYWYYRSLEKDGFTYLTANYYDESFTVQQFLREEVVSNGMLLDDMYLYAFDTLGKQVQVPVEILSGSTFPFEVDEKEGGVFLYKVKWIVAPEPLTTATLIRNRSFLGDTTYVHKDKEYPCVAFEVRELVESFIEGDGYAEPEFKGIEFYAKNIGLVYYRKQVSENFTVEYELVDRYDMDILEEKFKNSISNKPE